MTQQLADVRIYDRKAISIEFAGVQHRHRALLARTVQVGSSDWGARPGGESNKRRTWRRVAGMRPCSTR